MEHLEPRQMLATLVGDEFPVNTTVADDQFLPQVAAAADGQFVVVWDSLEQDGEGHGIFARRFGPDGTPATDELAVNSITAGDQIFPSVAMRVDGAFIAVWEDMDADGRGIRGRLFDAAGTPIGDDFPINDVASGDQLRPRVAADQQGNFMVVWTSTATGQRGIVARRFDAAGGDLGPAFPIHAATDDQQSLPAVAMNNDGHTVVTWEARPAPGELSTIMARQYAPDGTAGDPIRVSEPVAGSHWLPTVAMSLDGGFVVTWDRQQGDDHTAFAQPFSPSGERNGNAISVTASPANHSLFPSVAMDRQGDFIVVWDVFAKDGDGRGCFGQAFSRAGTPVDDVFQINTTITDDQEQPVTTISANSTFVVVWDSFGQDGDGRGVFGQRFALDQLNGSISGYVYADVNNNGVKDPPEIGLPNVPITLAGPTDMVVLTDANGFYHFPGVPPGNCTITQRQPSAFLDGIDSLGTPAAGRVVNNQFADVVLESGQDLVLYNFGERGLKPEFITKRLYLALTPSIGQLIANMDVDDPSTVLTFRPSAAGAFSAHVDGGEGEHWIELYSADMLPMLLGPVDQDVSMPVAEGEQYILFVGGLAEDEQVHLTARVVLPHPEPDGPCDVNLDGAVTPLDALVIINHLNTHGGSMPAGTPPSIDVNQDNTVSPLDALMVINHLNGSSGEGESPAPSPDNVASPAVFLVPESLTSDRTRVAAGAVTPEAKTAAPTSSDSLLMSLPWQLLAEPIHNRLVDLVFRETGGRTFTPEWLTQTLLVADTVD